MTAGNRVLVVEDEEMMRDLLSSLLEEAGYVVDLADSGDAGMRKIRKHPPDLVLLDLTMPGMNGWDVLERLKELPAPPTVIVMSGMQVAEPEELRAVNAFVYGYLAKPFNAQQLTRMCALALAAPRPTPGSVEVFADHRAEPRREILVPARLGSASGTPLVLGQILNLSPDGAMFDLGATLPTGKEVTLTFDIPGGHGFFQVTGRITWMKDGKLGVSFMNVPEEEKKRLGELLGSATGRT